MSISINGSSGINLPSDATDTSQAVRLSQIQSPGIINRTSGAVDLSLTRFDQIHRYSGTGNLIDINTLIAEDAVYEMHVNYTSSTISNYNVDPYLIPNSWAEAQNYTGQFQFNNLQKASNTNPTATPPTTILTSAQGSTASNDTATPSLQGFWFDQYYGALGVNGTTVLRLDNRRANKTVLFYGGDSNGIGVGHACWNIGAATSIQWYRIGRLRLYAGPSATWSNPDGASVPSAISWVINIRRIY